MTRSNQISNFDFMRAMANAPIDMSKCLDCGGLGMKPHHCCNDIDCWCEGEPIDWIESECKCDKPSNSQILDWAGEFNEIEVGE